MPRTPLQSWTARQGHLWIRPDTVDTDSCRYCEAPQRGGFLSLGQALTGFGRGTGMILLGDSTEAEIAGKIDVSCSLLHGFSG